MDGASFSPSHIKMWCDSRIEIAWNAQNTSTTTHKKETDTFGPVLPASQESSAPPLCFCHTQTFQIMLEFMCANERKNVAHKVEDMSRIKWASRAARRYRLLLCALWHPKNEDKKTPRWHLYLMRMQVYFECTSFFISGLCFASFVRLLIRIVGCTRWMQHHFHVIRFTFATLSIFTNA